MSNEMARRDNGGGNEMTAPGVEAKSLTAAMSSAAIEEIRAAFTMARTFPRDEDLARQNVVKVCKSPMFCAKSKAMYKFKIGGTEITGLSINVAKEMARAMGNIRYGFYVIHDTVDDRTIRCWAIDLESNLRNEADDTFQKTVFRKNDAGGYWKTVDERELLMLTNLKASKGIRNCLLNIMPFDLKETAIEVIQATVETKAAEDPSAFLRDLKDNFGEKNIRPDELRDYCLAFGQDLEKLPAKWLSHLRSVLNGIESGDTSWNDYLARAATKAGVDGPVTNAKDLAAKVAEKAAEGKKDGKTAEPKKEAPPETPKKEEEPAAATTLKDGGTTAPATPTRKRDKPAPAAQEDVSDGIV